MSLISRLLKHSLNRNPEYDLWFCRGKLPDGRALSLVYGGPERHAHYFAASMLQSPEIQRLGPASLSKSVSGAARLGASAVFIENSLGPEVLSEHGFLFRIPVWVDLHLALKGLNPQQNRPLANIRRYWNRMALEFATETSGDVCSRFYETMYRPFMEKSHGKSAFIYDRQEVKKRLANGKLIVGSRGGTPVAGVILEWDAEKREGKVSCMGVLEGRDDLLQEGIVGAVLFQALLETIQDGGEIFHLGYSRGFLRDGAFRFKARMGALLPGTWHRQSGHLSLRILDESDGSLRTLLADHPFLALEGDAMKAVFFTPEDKAPEDLLDLTKDSLCSGISRIEIFGAGKNETLMHPGYGIPVRIMPCLFSPSDAQPPEGMAFTDGAGAGNF